MRTLIDLRAAPPEDLRRRMRRSATSYPSEAQGAVREILEAVRLGGDAALSRYTARFDGATIEPDLFRVAASEIDSALAWCDTSLLDALRLAASRIEAYHRHQASNSERELDDGLVRVVELRRPVDRAGLYAPGGLHSYPSSVLMMAIPARVAGVGELALCVPPRPDGTVSPASLAAAGIAGVDEVWRVGGAQAVAAMAYGTETIRQVDLIVGPGNVYVTLAKRELAGLVGIDSLAGPSEVAIVADGTAPPEWIALDLFAQAEHGPLGSCLLVTWEADLASEVATLLERLIEQDGRPWMAEAARDAGRTILVSGPDQALDAVNAYAPEHLQLMVADYEPLLKGIRHAGAIFCGYDAPTALGDYIAGPNHVLPTAGSARFAQSLRVSTFEKVIHAIALCQGGFNELAEPAARIADAEGLVAHAQSLRGRL
jgi:histidinol dehydrogenase